MEDLKLTVNEDFAKKLHRQKERVELDQCKFCKAFREGLKIRIMLPVHVIIGSICACALTKIFKLKLKYLHVFLLHVFYKVNLHASSIVNRTQSNSISVELDQIQSNPIHGLSSAIEPNRTRTKIKLLGNRTKSSF